jgi:hypothetical protein
MTGLEIGYLIAAIVAVVGSGYSAYTQSEASKQQEKIADSQAEQERLNSERAAQEKANESEQERLNRQAQAKEERSSNLRRRAIIEGSYAKSGVLMDGTPGEFLAQQAETDELNIQRGDQQSRARSLGLKISGEALKSEGLFNSNVMKSQADAYGTQAKTSLIGGAIGAGGSAAKSYYGWMKLPKGEK